MTDTSTIERVREFWDARPCNIRHSDAPLGSVEFDRDVTRKKFKAEPHLAPFSEFTRNWGRVLDVGCGIGTQTLEFAKKSGNEVLGVDLSSNSLMAARSRLAVHPELKQRAAFVLEDAERSRTWSTFDLIYCWGVLHHTPDPASLLWSLRSYANWDSHLKLMVYHRWSWKALRIWLGFDQPEAQSGCPLARTYTKREITDLLARTGFRVTRIQTDHIFPYRVSDYRAGRFHKLWYFHILADSIFHWLELRFGWHLLIDAVPVNVEGEKQ